jgi:hypothetical protein
MAKKDEIELVGVVLKINGKRKVVKKENLHFHGWEQECEVCGSHSGVDMTVYDGNKSYSIDLDGY